MKKPNETYIIENMNTFLKSLFCCFVAALIIVSAACAPLSAEETERERLSYEEKYADEPEPEGDVARLMNLLDTCVGGQYVFGGQGDAITHKFIDTMYGRYPKYFDGGRLEYLRDIADNAESEGSRFPEDYAWDCSGLWWYAANELGLYNAYTDRTAHDTYHDYCTPIKKDELRPGNIVFLENDEKRIVHMGIVGRHGHIYEAVCGFAGVVYKRTVDKRVYNDIVRGGVFQSTSWNLFGRPKIFESVDG